MSMIDRGIRMTVLAATPVRANALANIGVLESGGSASSEAAAPSVMVVGSHFGDVNAMSDNYMLANDSVTHVAIITPNLNQYTFLRCDEAQGPQKYDLGTLYPFDGRRFFKLESAVKALGGSFEGNPSVSQGAMTHTITFSFAADRAQRYAYLTADKKQDTQKMAQKRQAVLSHNSDEVIATDIVLVNIDSGHILVDFDQLAEMAYGQWFQKVDTTHHDSKTLWIRYDVPEGDLLKYGYLIPNQEYKPNVAKPSTAANRNPQYFNLQGLRHPKAYDYIINDSNVETRLKINGRITYCNCFSWEVMQGMKVNEIDTTYRRYPQHEADKINAQYAAQNLATRIEPFTEVELADNLIYLCRGDATEFGITAPRGEWLKITPAEAQDYANLGCLTIVGWIKKPDERGESHIAPVRPETANHQMDREDGIDKPIIANAGATNFDYGTVTKAFGDKRYDVLQYFVYFK